MMRTADQEIKESELENILNVCSCFGERKICSFAHWCEHHCLNRFESEAPMGCVSCPFDQEDEDGR